MFAGFDKGEPVPHRRVGAGFRVGEDYVLRERCEKGARRFGSAGYTFPGLDRFTKAPDDMTAMVAANHWGFEVLPFWGNHTYMVVEEEPRETVTRIYVLCLMMDRYDEVKPERAEKLLFLP